MKTLEVLAVASELFPLIKTGGLADVCGALPSALKTHKVRMTTLLPGYPAVLRALARPRAVHAYDDLFGGRARVLAAKHPVGDLLILEAAHLYDRPGGPYGDTAGADFLDNALRFAALARAGADIGLGALAGYAPRVVHAHDWQAGLTAAYLAYDGRPRPGTVMTVHNLAFQGQFGRSLLEPLGLPPYAFTPDGVEYYGDIGFLKAGLRLSDRITTVSPTYAAEICTPEWGMGLDGLLRGRADRLSGILNGVDTAAWDPARDAQIAAAYDAGNLAAREADRADLRRRFGLSDDPEAPVFAVISRLSWQKGLDLLLEALPTILAVGGRLALVGAGDPDLVAGFEAAARAHPGRVGCFIGYDEALAHAVQAGADVLVVPSRFEPCGLTQLCGLRYGAVPLVARVGGLADTIVDAGPMALAAGAGTGFQFAPVTTPMLEHAIRRAAAMFRDKPAWRRLQANGMASDVSWREPARHYAELYRGLAAERAG